MDKPLALPPMKRIRSSHIHRWLWFFLGIVWLTHIVVAALVFNEMDGVLTGLTQMAGDPEAALAAESEKLVAVAKIRVLLISSAGFLLVGFLGYLWLRLASRHIHRPIQMIRHAVTRMAQGQLNETVAIGGLDDLAHIGSGLNELAANLQELLLYIWKQTGECRSKVAAINSILDEHSGLRGDPQIKESLQQLALSIDDLRMMAKAFAFFDVRLEGDRAMAINHPTTRAPLNPAADGQPCDEPGPVSN